MSNKTQYGALTEQGDLGLGFNQLNEDDNKKVEDDREKDTRKTEEKA